MQRSAWGHEHADASGAAAALAGGGRLVTRGWRIALVTLAVLAVAVVIYLIVAWLALKDSAR